MASSSGNVKLEIESDDKTENKWSVALGEDVFRRFFSKLEGEVAAQKVFGDGSLFSPFLFGKYFDPSDAFPLWEFESEALLSNLRSSGHCKVDWFQTDHSYVLKAHLPGNVKNKVRVYVDKGKVMEISGQWKQQTQTQTEKETEEMRKKKKMSNKEEEDRERKTKKTRKKDWRSGEWWEYGFVRRLELPGDGDSSAADAFVFSDDLFEIHLPKKNSKISHGGDGHIDSTCKISLDSAPR